MCICRTDLSEASQKLQHASTRAACRHTGINQRSPLAARDSLSLTNPNHQHPKNPREIGLVCDTGHGPDGPRPASVSP